MRFPEFKGEWTKISLNNCCDCFDYGLNEPSVKYDGFNRYLRITDIDDETRGISLSEPVSPKSFSSEYSVNKGDLLFARTGASVGKTYLYKPSDGKMYFAGFLIRAHIKDEFSDKFIYQQTLRQDYKNWVKLMSARSGQPGINSKQYASYNFFKPEIAEQNKIALFLNDIDSRIAMQRKTIEDYENLMNVGINAEYSDKKALVKIGLRIIQSAARNTMNIGNVYSVSNKDGFIPQKDQFDGREVASENTGNYKIVEKGMFAFNPARINVGSIALYELDNPCVVSPMYICFKPIELNANYLRYFFRTQSFKKQLHSKLEGSVRQCLSFEALREFYLPNRSFNHIAKFCDGIHVLEVKINREKHILESLFGLKHYLLRNLFI